MSFVTRLISVLSLLAITACGGGGGPAGTNPFPDPGTGGGGGSTMTVTLSSSTVTSTAPANVTATLRDSTGTGIANAVVTFANSNTTLATLSSNSALTNSQGVATVTLRSAGAGVDGAGTITATATAGSTQVQGSAGFNVTVADTPTLSLTPSSATLRYSTSPLTMTARVLNAAGNPVANQIVTFSATNSLVTIISPSALTNANGDASVTVRPVSPSSSGAEIVTASATVSGRELQSLASLQLVAEAPSLSATISSSTITSTAPATLRVVARDLSGNLLPGAVVRFTSQGSLATFTPATAVTASTGNIGEATTVVSPAATTSAGADVLQASLTVQGVTTTVPVVVQFVTSAPSGTPTFTLALSGTSISAASPATVTATLRDATGVPVAGQVVTFSVIRGLASTNVNTALTNASGQAVVLLSPASAASAGADEIAASVSYAGVGLQQSQGFQVQATPVTLDSFTAAVASLSAYGQTTLTVQLTGASVTAPVNITVSSSCVTQGKATLSPSSFTTTSGTVMLQYRDNGCGAVQNSDQLQLVVTATGASRALTLPIQAPAAGSIAFISAAPEQIYLRGSGFTETSLLTFEVRDGAGNPLPNRAVELRLQTGAGGVTMEGRGVESVNPPSANPFTLTSNASGQIAVRVNSGTLPTPVRVHALLAGTSIATVSSNLSVAIGLPSQLNFSLSQGTRNIEGYNIDGTPNTYQIIAADRSGNPVPAGTSINFVTEGGQIEAIKQTQIVSGISRTVANFVSAEPRPVDGRVTITAYALGEESFIDQNGNNAHDPSEPFQDLGNIFKDRNFDGSYDPDDEYVPLQVNNDKACTAPANPLLLLDPSIPSVSTPQGTAPGTCDSVWSGAGQVYVRRATETVLSTSAARPLWASTSGLDGTCSRIRLQTGPAVSNLRNFAEVSGDTWYGNAAGALNFIVADANPGRPILPFTDPLVDYSIFPRLNPMAAGTTIGVSSPTPGFTASLGGGSPVPSTTSASLATASYVFTDQSLNGGNAVVFVTFTSPSGVGTTVSVRVTTGPRPPSTCTP